VKIEDFGLILLLFAIGGQVISSFLVIRIPFQGSNKTLSNQIYSAIAGSGVTLNASTTQNTSGKTWHTVEIWGFSVVTEVTVSSSNYLIFLKAEDRSDFDTDIIKEEVVERLNTKLGKLRNKIRRVLSRIEVSFVRVLSSHF
jgi:hypothetical protein